MPRLDPGPSVRRRLPGMIRHMDILVVLILIVVIGLFAQVVGSDSRGFSARAA